MGKLRHPMVKRIGLFGGSFDPVHHGHLIIACHALEELELDEVRLLPAAASPFKNNHAYAPAPLRLAMLQAAVQGERGLIVDDRELHRSPPSFTIDTVDELRGEFPDAEFLYLIGEDNVCGLPNWHCSTRLQEEVEFVVFRRGPQAALNHSLRIITKMVDISATEIRTRIAQGSSIRYLVPECVREIIFKENVYGGK